MTTYDGPKTKTAILDALMVKRERDIVRLSLGDEDIGRIVSFGRFMPSRGSATGSRKTIYGSRVSFRGSRIEVEGVSVQSVLNKVASEIASVLKNADKDEPETVSPSMR